MDGEERTRRGEVEAEAETRGGSQEEGKGEERSGGGGERRGGGGNRGKRRTRMRQR